MTLPDAAARAAVATRLDENLLVEAGAGSGKTTELVRRMVALVRTGTATVDEIAAVTFTRKAASELRERFQDELEAVLTEARGAGDEVAPLERALRDIDRAFVGTIHAFCARLLRERPLEARIDPGFRETLEDEERRRAKRFWALWLERAASSEDPALEELARVGIEPSQLESLYFELQQYDDVDFELRESKPPDPALVASVREELEELLRRSRELWDGEAPPKGPDSLQKRLKTLYYLERMTEWKGDAVFRGIAELARSSSYKVTQNRWADDAAGKERARKLGEDFDAFRSGPVDTLLTVWWAHRYPAVVRFARAASDAYREHRRREGWLNFQDLLMVAARLLRESPAARSDLGERYRRLLVDEFQDTDPIQAEILFLLASSPSEGSTWTEVEPRPGQLFVVGDPKQSIYRFRRADISIYETVRRRFGEIGDVVRLTSNFRSRPPIADLVNATFQGPGGSSADEDTLDRFPPEPVEEQAAFAPLEPRREDEPPAEGVFWYELEGESRSASSMANEDARRLAAWIHGRTRGPGADRRPGDFLVLTRLRSYLDVYASHIEAWGLPVQVSGAGVSAEDELGELLLLLRALSDPEDGVAVLAVLTGLFFGRDAETLLRHRTEGGRFDFRAPEADGDPDVRDALRTLNRWWRWSRVEPADIVVGRIVEEVGIVPHAAAEELGQVRAGALFYGLDAVRQVALEGDTSLAGATDALEGVVEAGEAEAPLEPGRADAVQLMNLHKAKGLEAPVVVLALPRKRFDPDPTLHVERTEPGESRGWLTVSEKSGWSTVTHARPMDWPEREAREKRFDRAEETRLLYVAATRARDELVVSRKPGRDDESAWSALHPWLEEHGRRLEMPLVEPPDPEVLPVSAGEIEEAVDSVESDRLARGRPTYHFQTVTERVRGGASDAGPPPADLAPEDTSGPQTDLFAGRGGATLEGDMAEAPRPESAPVSSRSTSIDDEDEGPLLHGGPDWGSAVHAALEAAARDASGEVLRSVARAHLIEYERPVDDAGEPVELEALLDTVRAVRASEIWRRAEAAERRLAEVAFALELPPGRGEAEVAPEGPADPGAPVYLDGQVDLAFREDGEWVLVDYKTDIDPPDYRMRKYRRQLVVYAEAWERATGEPVKERLILMTRRGEVVGV